MDELIYKLAFNFIPNVGAKTSRDLISYCGGIKEVFSANKKTLLKVPGVGEKRAEDILASNALEEAEKELRVIENEDVKVTFYLDDNYPQRLKHYPDSPILLYHRGDIDFENARNVAIVGTRKPTNYGVVQCEKLVDELSEYNVNIISGLAYGIDTTAHRRAVEKNIPTVGILGNGLCKIYPAANHSLSKKMENHGGVMSEFPMNTGPDRENFPKRNRIISAFSDVVIVIESARKGGSMITALYANDQNKDVFALPGKITDPLSEGCNHLIKTNQAHLITSAADIAYIMRWDQSQTTTQMEMVMDLTAEEKVIVDLLRGKEMTIDSLMYQSKVNLSSLSSMLLNLEFRGIVRSLPGKKYTLL